MSTEKTFPADWEQPITARGVTRNVAQKCYNVRISVAGKQLHVATSRIQGDAAKLYDMALWKFRGKMFKAAMPNDAEGFSLITQRQIDTHCPRLNMLYTSLPYLNQEDEWEDEEKLRERMMRRSSGNVFGQTKPESEMHDYDKAVEFLRRAVVDIADLECKLANRMGRLTRLHKLAEAPLEFKSFGIAFATARIHGNRLRDSLERQREYYQKQIDNS